MWCQLKEKGAKAGLMYAILILGLLAGSVIISIAYVYESWLYILFGVSFAATGLLLLIKSVV
ncbi:MAG TPA: hypothetical protein GX709_03455 [Clostridiales bacterium]|nr:hypothetical protein [Clostridiales bacterium]